MVTLQATNGYSRTDLSPQQEFGAALCRYRNWARATDGRVFSMSKMAAYLSDKLEITIVHQRIGQWEKGSVAINHQDRALLMGIVDALVAHGGLPAERAEVDSFLSLGEYRALTDEEWTQISVLALRALPGTKPLMLAPSPTPSAANLTPLLVSESPSPSPVLTDSPMPEESSILRAQLLQSELLAFWTGSWFRWVAHVGLLGMAAVLSARYLSFSRDPIGTLLAAFAASALVSMALLVVPVPAKSHDSHRAFRCWLQHLPGAMLGIFLVMIVTTFVGVTLPLAIRVGLGLVAVAMACWGAIQIPLLHEVASERWKSVKLNRAVAIGIGSGGEPVEAIVNGEAKR